MHTHNNCIIDCVHLVKSGVRGEIHIRFWN